MRRSTSYLTGIACLWALAGAAGAQEPPDSVSLPPGSEISLPANVEGPFEVHVFTPPEEQLKGPDIQVLTWSPETPLDRYIVVKTWEPGQPSGIRVIDTQNNDPSRIPVYTWSPSTPGDRDIIVHTWEPGRPSLIRVHGPQ